MTDRRDSASSNSSAAVHSGAQQALSPYGERVLQELKQRVPWEREFLQAVEEVFLSVSPVLLAEPRLERERVLERLVEPERTINFRVVWTDDRGRTQVNRGWRVQFNSVLGPYKGGLRFHTSVDLGSLKFLGFEQTFKNALTGLPMGGGKGGADFHPRAKSDAEIMRFCQAFMSELFRHIGANTDVPAGDIGVGTREIGYLFGQYRKLTRLYEGVLTGKGIGWGGSLMRPEATGYGVVYFAEEILNARGDSLRGKTVAVSGFGNVAWGAVEKVNAFGGKVVTLSGPDGFVHDPDGVEGEKVEFMLAMRHGGRDEVKEYADKFGVAFHAGKRPWGVPVDVALPCAIQNELEVQDARNLVQGGCKLVVEGANMPTTPEAIDVLHANGVTYAPGKASNAGGVATSGLEMAQNSARLFWPAEKVDAHLHEIMRGIHKQCVEASERYGAPGNYMVGANIAGFRRVVDALLDQGTI